MHGGHGLSIRPAMEASPMPPLRHLRIGIVGNVRSPIIGRYLDGMIASANVQGSTTIVDLRVAAEFPRFKTTDVPPWQGRVDGVVLAIGYEGPTGELIEWVMRGGVPAVSVRGDILDPRLPVIYTDPESIARLAMDHLLGIGVESFLHVGYTQTQGARTRAEAFARALAQRGRATVVHDIDILLFGGIDDEALLEQDRRLTELLTSLPRPLGVLCLNDWTARAVVFRCQRLGLDVPGDVAVVGVDDSALAAGSVPSLTSIKVPCETVAARGVTVLRELIAAGQVSRPELPVELVPATELVPRESTVGRPDGAGSLVRWLAYLDEHAHKGPPTTQIAEELGVSRRTFERQFRRLVGHSPSDEIRLRRLERAKMLLADPAVPITAVAAEVGFAEAAAFTRFFRRHVGQTPREFRRAATGQPEG